MSLSLQFNLVCGDEYLVELSSTLIMFGVLIGGTTSGVISDR